MKPRPGCAAGAAVALLFALGTLQLAFAEPYDPGLGATIDAYLEGKGSPIAGEGATFFQAGVSWNVDPRLIVAIAGVESSFGTNWQACPESGNNAWSWFWCVATGACSLNDPVSVKCQKSPFASFAEGIQTVTQFMRLSYINRGYNTIPLIGGLYCAAGCADWVPNVTKFYADPNEGLGGDPQVLVFKRTLVDFEQFAGRTSVFTEVEPPLGIGVATFSGGQLLSATTFLPADQSVVYGTAFICGGCSPTITIDFTRKVSNVSLFLLNGQTFTVTYTVTDDRGAVEVKSVVANSLSGSATIDLPPSFDTPLGPTSGITKVTITSNAGGSWDFFIDNIRFAVLQTTASQ